MESDRSSRWIPVGAVLAGLSVATGAVAAHRVDAYLIENYAGLTIDVSGVPTLAARKYLADFKTAAQYQMLHSLGLIVVGLLATRRPGRVFNASGWLFIAGICLFCGSLYWLSLFSYVMDEQARHRVGLMAAAGGTSFILGWLVLAVGACLGRRPTDSPASPG